MGKLSDCGSSSGSSPPETPREPPELVDPITLTLMEEAVMVTCGHSFSKASITAWLRQQQGSSKTCPVCKSPISEASVLPNWALRNAVDRYCEKHGIKQTTATASGEGAAMEPSAPTMDAEDGYPMKPSASVASPSAPPSYVFDASEDTPSRPAATTTTTTSTSPSYQPYVPASGAGNNDDGGCECCQFEKPSGKHGCCVWECSGCGVCKMADDCSPGCAIMLPSTTLLCGVSFGKCSNWWTRTICGSIYPVFLALVCFLVIADLVIVCTLWTAWSLYIPLGMLFFLMTHYFCPIVNETVTDRCGAMGSFLVGNTC